MAGAFPFTPTSEFIFGEGADRPWLQTQHDYQLAGLVAYISELDRADARRMFEQLRDHIEQLRKGSLFGPLLEHLSPDYGGRLETNLPEEWNDLVVMFVRTPALKDFSSHVRKLSEAEVLRIATQAVMQRSLTKAKLALAYAAEEMTEPGTHYSKGHSWLPYREMLGDELVSELSRLIETLHDEQGLFIEKKSRK